MRLILAILLVVNFAISAVAEEHPDYGPEIPSATGEPHPQGNEFMRKFHMDLLSHDRDLTMYEGIRDTDASLKSCFDCHAVTDQATGNPVTYEDERNFCRVCHDYAAVRVDCFMCHRSTPEGFNEPALLKSRLLGPDDGLDDALFTELAAFVANLE
ncbi:MAG: hypothetical protein QGI08_14135 [Paracoccaceae bacterium]|jgi:hypothetical protein|nr:hypothetical protein [Paracoccaceae bacterium]MDP7186856.1 hypothetical protein [Paracoccaceae bacterium]